MEFNCNVILLVSFTTFLITTQQVSCIRFSFLFPEKPSPSPALSPSSSPSTSPSLPLDSVPLPNTIKTFFDDLKKPVSEIPKQVEEACKRTDFPIECSSSMATILKGEKMDPETIFKGEAKAFDHALEVAKAGIADLSNVANDKDTLSTCEEMYDNAREEINKAMELASGGHDNYGATMRLSAALTFVETCVDGLLQDMGGDSDSPVIRINDMLERLASNSLALGNFAMGKIDDDDI